MLSKSKIKVIRSLKLQKYRQKYHQAVVEGAKLVDEVLRNDQISVNLVVSTGGWAAENAQHPGLASVESAVLPAHAMKKISSFKTPPEVLAVVTPNHQIPAEGIVREELCLYLDGIRDPGNVGTILRIADWFGFRNVYLSPDTVDIYNPKVIQASMGSVFRVRSAETPFNAIAGLDDVPVFMAVLDGAPVNSVPNPGHGVIVLGNESSGIRPEVLMHPHEAITIPAADVSGAESLNVAVSAGIICAHFKLYAQNV